jgi:hypothetical protein
VDRADTVTVVLTEPIDTSTLTDDSVTVHDIGSCEPCPVSGVVEVDETGTTMAACSSSTASSTGASPGSTA